MMVRRMWEQNSRQFGVYRHGVLVSGGFYQRSVALAAAVNIGAVQTAALVRRCRFCLDAIALQDEPGTCRREECQQAEQQAERSRAALARLRRSA